MLYFVYLELINGTILINREFKKGDTVIYKGKQVEIKDINEPGGEQNIRPYYSKLVRKYVSVNECVVGNKRDTEVALKSNLIDPKDLVNRIKNFLEQSTSSTDFYFSLDDLEFKLIDHSYLNTTSVSADYSSEEEGIPFLNGDDYGCCCYAKD